MRDGNLMVAVSVAVLSFAILAVTVGDARAQTGGLFCADRSVLARESVPGRGTGIAVDGDLAFVAVSFAGLQVVDVSDQTSPALLGLCETPSSALQVAISGDIAFVTTSGAGLLAIDVSDPSAPQIVGSIGAGGRFQGLAVEGGIAYVADWDSGLEIFDVTDPTDLTRIGGLAAGRVSAVAIDGTLAYVADEMTGVLVIDVSDPSDPVPLGSLPAPGPLDIVVDGAVGYAATRQGLAILDLADPTAPAVLATDESLGVSADIAVADGRVYLRGASLVCDVADPARPSLIGQFPNGGADSVLRNGLAYVADNSSIAILDVARPTPPGLRGELVTSTSQFEGVQVHGSFAYLTEGTEGVAVVDISDATNPTRVTSVPAAMYSHDIAISGDYAFVADTGSGLMVLDLTEPASPVVVVEPTDFSGVRLEADGHMLGVLGSQFLIIDISDPLAPTQLAWHPDGAGPGRRHGNLRLEAGHAWVASRDFWIYDLSDPTADPIAEVDIPWFATAIDVEGDIACVGGLEGMIVYDVSDPSSPVELSSIAIGFDGPESIRLIGDYALVGTFRYGEFWVIDLTDPNSPKLGTTAMGWLGGSSTVWDMVLQDSLAYIVRATGLSIIDISDCPPCPADFNADGTVNTQDFIAFLAAWASQRNADCSSGDCSADLNADGTVNTQDFVEFLNLWAAGC